MYQNDPFENPSIQNENAFNAIRFYLCMTVVTFHSLTNISIGNNNPFLDGHLAVSGFFIISGFWITKSFLSSKDLKDFFSKRLKKILPMYYIAVIGFSILCLKYSTLSPKEYFGIEYWKYLFWNCIFLNFMHPSLPGCFDGAAVNGSLWTIKIEVGFYIILPLLMHIMKKLKTTMKKNIFLISIYILSVLYNVALHRLASKWNLPAQLEHQLPGLMSFFVSGMIIFLNWQYFIKYKNFLIIPSIVLFVLRYYTHTEFLFPIAFSIIITFLALSLKFLKSIGRPIDFSWGMYLFHFPVMQIIKYHGFSGNALIYLFSVIGISFTLTFIIEKYIQKKIK